MPPLISACSGTPPRNSIWLTWRGRPAGTCRRFPRIEACDIATLRQSREAQAPECQKSACDICDKPTLRTLRGLLAALIRRACGRTCPTCCGRVARSPRRATGSRPGGRWRNVLLRLGAVTHPFALRPVADQRLVLVSALTGVAHQALFVIGTRCRANRPAVPIGCMSTSRAALPTGG
jgi:hypothetical protein